MSTTRVCVALAMALSLAGCVKKSTHEALQSQYDAAQAELASTREALSGEQGKSKSLEEALAEEQKKVEALDAEIKRVSGELKAASQRGDKLQDELTNVVKDRSRLKSSVEEMKIALEALEKQRARTDARVAEYKKLLGRFKSLIDAGKLKVKVVGGRMVVELPSDILFASGSVELSEDGIASIREMTQVLAEMKGRQFQVEGHTDNEPIRTARFPNNWSLAAGRAIAVSGIMIEAGLSPENVSAASYGEFHPVASNDSDAGRASNRRIEIVLVPDFSILPGFEELEQLGK